MKHLIISCRKRVGWTGILMFSLGNISRILMVISQPGKIFSGLNVTRQYLISACYISNQINKK